MKEHQMWAFTCESCGGHKLNVYRVWKILAGPDSETWQEWGPLETDHTWKFEFKEKVEKDNDNEIERGDFGEFAKDDSSSKPEEYEIFESEDNPGNDKFYVNCASCDREIEFGWSQSNHRGAYFPLNVLTSSPEKFGPSQDIWIPGNKGWLQKGEELS